MEIRTSDIELFVSVESLIESLKRDPIDNDVDVIVLKINNPALFCEKSYDLEILGKSLTNWVKLAFDQCPITEVVCDMSADIISSIKPHLKNKKYTAVFYADTPLLQRRTFLNILDWVQTKKMNVCKLERGWVFVTDFIKNAEKIFTTTEAHDFGKEDFLTVFNLSNFELAGQILKDRIINFHQQNGVQILDRKTTFIDADVSIEKNAVIYPNNIISGSTIIEEGAKIESFCTIKNSRIGKNSVVSSSYIEKSDIKENSKIAPFSCIINGNKKR